MDINRSVFLGVEDSRVETQDSARCWFLHGWQFDARDGFGGREDHYEGEVAIISGEAKIIKYLSIGKYHSSKRSWGWWIETDELPEPPFIITNRLQTKLIFDGDIEIELYEEGKKFFSEQTHPDSMGELAGYVVLGSSDWFGTITTITGSGSYQLLAYSDIVEQGDILNSEMIANDDVAEDMDELILLEPEVINVKKYKPFGRVIRLIPQPEMSLTL